MTVAGDLACAGEVESGADAEAFAGGLIVDMGGFDFAAESAEVPLGKACAPSAGGGFADTLVDAAGSGAFAMAADVEAAGSEDDILFAAIEGVAIDVGGDEGGGDGAHDERVELGMAAGLCTAEAAFTEVPVVLPDAGQIFDIDAEVEAAGGGDEGGVAFDDGFGVALEVAEVKEGGGAEEREGGVVVGAGSFEFGVEGAEVEGAIAGEVEIGGPAMAARKANTFVLGGSAASGTGLMA